MLDNASQKRVVSDLETLDKVGHQQQPLKIGDNVTQSWPVHRADENNVLTTGFLEQAHEFAHRSHTHPAMRPGFYGRTCGPFDTDNEDLAPLCPRRFGQPERQWATACGDAEFSLACHLFGHRPVGIMSMTGRWRSARRHTERAFTAGLNEIHNLHRIGI